MNVFKRSVNGKLVEVFVDGESQPLPDSSLKLGDKIAKVATPIARALRLSCIDEHGQLKPTSGCAKRRDWINNMAGVAYDLFWQTNKLEKTTMQFAITKTTTETFVVEADDAKAAAELGRKGEGNQRTHNETMSVQPRPAQPVRPNPMQPGMMPTGVLPRPPMPSV